MGTPEPQNGWFLMENLVKMDDARVYHGVRSKRRESPGEDILNTVKERNRSFNVQFSGGVHETEPWGLSFLFDSGHS